MLSRRRWVGFPSVCVLGVVGTVFLVCAGGLGTFAVDSSTS